MRSLEPLLGKSALSHKHLCPRQILGVRIGLAGMNIFGFDESPTKKKLLVISETDGCFVDGLTVATGCTVGHRTLRLEDYGKVAATFANIQTGRAVRIVPAGNVRDRAFTYAPGEGRPYFAQMRAYRVMPEDELLIIQQVKLNVSVDRFMSRAGKRVNCSGCGEEIINEREIIQDGLILCLACAGNGYYQPALVYPFQLNPQGQKKISKI